MNVSWRTWRGLGLTPIPLLWRSKKPRVAWLKFTSKPVPEGLYDLWFDRTSNVGILIKDGLVVLDFDDGLRYHSELPRTLTVKTRRGYHFYFFVEEEPNLAMKGGDIKGRGYVVAPPSIHPSGFEYKVDVMADIARIRSLHDLPIEYTEKPKYSYVPHGRIELKENSGVVDKIKYYIPIAKFISRFTSLEYVGVGNSTLVGICPFHDDRSPSLQVFTNDNHIFCHSTTCVAHRRIDIIDAYSILMSCSVQEAIYDLAREIPE